MPSERVQQQIDALLSEAEAALKALNWDVVRERSQAVLSLDESNEAAIAYLEAAEAKLTGPGTPSAIANAAGTVAPPAYEYHSVNVRALTWSMGAKIDEIGTKMSEAGWEFVEQVELRAPSTSGLDRQAQLTFRRVKREGNPPAPVGGCAWGCLLPMMSRLILMGVAFLA